MKKQIIGIFLSIVIFIGGAFALNSNQAFAATECPEEGLEGMQFLFFKGPLVPCGINKECAGNNENISINKPCTLCHFIVLIQNFFNFLLSLLIIVSIFMLTVAGVLYIVSAGGKMTTMAKEIIHKTLLGFGIFLLSWLIVFTLLSLLSVNTTMIGKGEDGLFQFTCDDDSEFYIPPEGGGDNGGGGGGGTTPGLPPGEADARTNLFNDSNGHITVWQSEEGETNIRDLRPGTRDRLLEFQRESGLDILVTGGAEADGPHSTNGEYTHANGWKVDIEDTPAVNNYIENNYTYLGDRAGDGDRVYSDGNGNYFVREGSHWDVYMGTPQPPLSS